jgi:shikimate kinase
VAEALIDDEPAFRAAEEQLVLAALAEPGAIVAVGSGATSPAVTEALTRVPVIWLEAGLAETARRTGLSGMRPPGLGNVRGQLHQMLRERAGFYASVADLQVAVDSRSPADIADEIQDWEARR